MKLVSVFMDVEDPVNPLADDAALDCAQLFSDAGVRGSFCITGEKCRSLAQRGRSDVIQAFQPHCLGLHTDTHSYHPTTMELLANLDWERGCEAAYVAESKGVESFRHTFAHDPEFWGGAGNTWSPEITEAMKRLNIPAYVYALTSLPGNPVHRFNGVVGVPQMLSISEDHWADPQSSAPDLALEMIEKIDHPWVTVFVGHPTRLRYAEFWDKPYWKGRTPAEPEFAPLVGDAVYRRSLERISTFLTQLKRQQLVLGLDEALAQSWRFRSPSEDELDFFSVRTVEALHQASMWPVHREGLDCSLIVQKTLALKATVEVADVLIP